MGEPAYNTPFLSSSLCPLPHTPVKCAGVGGNCNSTGTRSAPYDGSYDRGRYTADNSSHGPWQVEGSCLHGSSTRGQYTQSNGPDAAKNSHHAITFPGSGPEAIPQYAPSRLLSGKRFVKEKFTHRVLIRDIYEKSLRSSKCKASLSVARGQIMRERTIWILGHELDNLTAR